MLSEHWQGAGRVSWAVKWLLRDKCGVLQRAGWGRVGKVTVGEGGSPRL